jgi:enterochelin esterase-like enzyme
MTDLELESLLLGDDAATPSTEPSSEDLLDSLLQDTYASKTQAQRNADFDRAESDPEFARTFRPDKYDPYAIDQRGIDKYAAPMTWTEMAGATAMGGVSLGWGIGAGVLGFGPDLVKSTAEFTFKPAWEGAKELYNTGHVGDAYIKFAESFRDTRHAFLRQFPDMFRGIAETAANITLHNRPADGITIGGVLDYASWDQLDAVKYRLHGLTGGAAGITKEQLGERYRARWIQRHEAEYGSDEFANALKSKEIQPGGTEIFGVNLGAWKDDFFAEYQNHESTRKVIQENPGSAWLGQQASSFIIYGPLEKLAGKIPLGGGRTVNSVSKTIGKRVMQGGVKAINLGAKIGLNRSIVAAALGGGTMALRGGSVAEIALGAIGGGAAAAVIPGGYAWRAGNFMMPSAARRVMAARNFVYETVLKEPTPDKQVYFGRGGVTNITQFMTDIMDDIVNAPDVAKADLERSGTIGANMFTDKTKGLGLTEEQVRTGAREASGEFVQRTQTMTQEVTGEVDGETVTRPVVSERSFTQTLTPEERVAARTYDRLASKFDPKADKGIRTTATREEVIDAMLENLAVKDGDRTYGSTKMDALVAAGKIDKNLANQMVNASRFAAFVAEARTSTYTPGKQVPFYHPQRYAKLNLAQITSSLTRIAPEVAGEMVSSMAFAGLSTLPTDPTAYELGMEMGSEMPGLVSMSIPGIRAEAAQRANAEYRTQAYIATKLNRQSLTVDAKNNLDTRLRNERDAALVAARAEDDPIVKDMYDAMPQAAKDLVNGYRSDAKAEADARMRESDQMDLVARGTTTPDMLNKTRAEIDALQAEKAQQEALGNELFDLNQKLNKLRGLKNAPAGVQSEVGGLPTQPAPTQQDVDNAQAKVAEAQKQADDNPIDMESRVQLARAQRDLNDLQNRIKNPLGVPTETGGLPAQTAQTAPTLTPEEMDAKIADAQAKYDELTAKLEDANAAKAREMRLQSLLAKNEALAQQVGNTPEATEPATPASGFRSALKTSQRRNLNNQEAILLMHKIANAPSTTLNESSGINGAPVVMYIGDNQAESGINVSLGKQDSFRLASGKQVTFRWGLMDADDAQSSNFYTGDENGDWAADGTYSAVVGRTRLAGAKQGFAIKGGMGPHGAMTPIVADARAKASGYGIAEADFDTYAKPMLVRVMANDYSAFIEVGRTGDETETNSMSVMDDARADEVYIDQVIGLVDINKDITKNKPLVDAFIAKIRQSSPTQVRKLVDDFGRLNVAGYVRLNAAIMQYAFGTQGERAQKLIGSIVNAAPDDEISKNLTSVLSRIAPTVALYNRTQGVAGHIPTNITQSLIEAADLYVRLKADGQNIGDWLTDSTPKEFRGADEISADDVSDLTRETISLLFENLTGFNKLIKIYKGVYTSLVQDANPDVAAKIGMETISDLDRLRNATKSVAIQSSPSTNAPIPAEIRNSISEEAAYLFPDDRQAQNDHIAEQQNAYLKADWETQFMSMPPDVMSFIGQYDAAFGRYVHLNLMTGAEYRQKYSQVDPVTGNLVPNNTAGATQRAMRPMLGDTGRTQAVIDINMEAGRGLLPVLSEEMTHGISVSLKMLNPRLHADLMGYVHDAVGIENLISEEIAGDYFSKLYSTPNETVTPADALTRRRAEIARELDRLGKPSDADAVNIELANYVGEEYLADVVLVSGGLWTDKTLSKTYYANTDGSAAKAARARIALMQGTIAKQTMQINPSMANIQAVNDPTGTIRGVVTEMMAAVRRMETDPGLYQDLLNGSREYDDRDFSNTTWVNQAINSPGGWLGDLWRKITGQPTGVNVTPAQIRERWIGIRNEWDQNRTDDLRAWMQTLPNAPKEIPNPNPGKIRSAKNATIANPVFAKKPQKEGDTGTGYEGKFLGSSFLRLKSFQPLHKLIGQLEDAMVMGDNYGRRFRITYEEQDTTRLGKVEEGRPNVEIWRGDNPKLIEREIIPLNFQIVRNTAKIGDQVDENLDLSVFAVDVDTMRAIAVDMKAQRELAPWGGDVDAFMEDVFNYGKAHMADNPGISGLNRTITDAQGKVWQLDTKVKADIINKMFTKDMGNKGPWRTFKVGRLMQMSDTGQAGVTFNYPYIQKNYSPSPDATPGAPLTTADIANDMLARKEVDPIADASVMRTLLEYPRQVKPRTDSELLPGDAVVYRDDGGTAYSPERGILSPNEFSAYAQVMQPEDATRMFSPDFQYDSRSRYSAVNQQFPTNDVTYESDLSALQQYAEERNKFFKYDAARHDWRTMDRNELASNMLWALNAFPKNVSENYQEEQNNARVARGRMLNSSTAENKADAADAMDSLMGKLRVAYEGNYDAVDVFADRTKSVRLPTSDGTSNAIAFSPDTREWNPTKSLPRHREIYKNILSGSESSRLLALQRLRRLGEARDPWESHAYAHLLRSMGQQEMFSDMPTPDLQAPPEAQKQAKESPGEWNAGMMQPDMFAQDVAGKESTTPSTPQTYYQPTLFSPIHQTIGTMSAVDSVVYFQDEDSVTIHLPSIIKDFLDDTQGVGEWTDGMNDEIANLIYAKVFLRNILDWSNSESLDEIDDKAYQSLMDSSDRLDAFADLLGESTSGELLDAIKDYSLIKEYTDNSNLKQAVQDINVAFNVKNKPKSISSPTKAKELIAQSFQTAEINANTAGKNFPLSPLQYHALMNRYAGNEVDSDAVKEASKAWENAVKDRRIAVRNEDIATSSIDFQAGIPMPSLAVIKPSVGFGTKFGDGYENTVTYLFDAHVSDPSVENVYSGDAWTPTFLGMDNIPKDVFKDENKAMAILSQGQDFDASSANWRVRKASDIEDLRAKTDYISSQDQYGEAKPKRIVRWNEVAAAILPSSVDAEFVAKLREKGVEPFFYDEEKGEYDKSNSRQMAIQAATIKKTAEGRQILFSPEGRPGAATVEFDSPALNRPWRVRTYLPEGYDGTKRYPVIYFLHGMGSDETMPEQIGYLPKNHIVIAPNGYDKAGRASFWQDQDSGDDQFSLGVAQDLVGWTDRTFRTIPSPEGRKLAGVSMGGQGALGIAINRPGVFGSVYAHSPIFRTQANMPEYLDKSGKYIAQMPYERVQAGAMPDVPVYMDIAADDPVDAANDVRGQRMRKMLAAQGKLAGGEVWGYGGHTNDHWRGLSAKYRALHGDADTPQNAQFSPNAKIYSIEKKRIDQLKPLMRFKKDAQIKTDDTRPILIDSDGVVLDGNHRLELAKRRGDEFIDTVVSDQSKRLTVEQEYKAILGQLTP